ncbi:MAG: SurA N-terminal domain-containing protein [Elusimicrobiaceae bacterium]|nr:SurA N-terminal domain-containing protein [Elusimicrobiaceae bacterium]
MKVNKTILLGALTILALNANAKVIDSSVATVNSKPILSSQYDKMTKAVLAQYEQRAPQVLQDQNAVNAIKEQVLNEMISEELMLQAAQKEGIKVKDSELAQAINAIKQRFMLDPNGKERSKKEADAAFNQALKEEGMSYKQFENKTKEQLAVRKMIDSIVQANAKKPTEADVKQLFEDVQVIMKGDKQKVEKLPKERVALALPLAAKLNQLTAEQIKVSPIFIKADKTLSKTALKDKENEARKIRKDIKNGKITMLDAIKLYSDDKTPLATGGEVILIRGVMPKDFDNKIFNVAVGEISEPLQTEGGFYIIRVNEKRAKQDVTLDKIQNELSQYVYAANMQKAMEDYLVSLKDKADVKVMVKFDYTDPAKETKKETKTETKK